MTGGMVRRCRRIERTVAVARTGGRAGGRAGGLEDGGARRACVCVCVCVAPGARPSFLALFTIPCGLGKPAFQTGVPSFQWNVLFSGKQ